MSFEYGDPSDSDKDAVRLMVGDTVEADALLTDEEINFLLTQEGELYRAASAAADACAAMVAKLVSNSQEGASAQLSDMYEHYRELGRSLRVKAQSKSGIEYAYTGLVDAQGETREPYFKVGMMENPGTETDDRLTSPVA